MSALALLAAACVAAPPAFFQKADGTDISAMVRRGVKVVSQLPIDVVGTSTPERVVLLGQAGADGVVSAVGLAVLDTASGLRVVASMPLPTNTSYSVTFGATPVDLDGDGKVEIALDTVAVAPDLFRVEDTLYVRVANGQLSVAYTLARAVERGTRREARSFKVAAPGVIEETVRIKDGAERVDTVRLTFDASEGRFRSR